MKITNLKLAILLAVTLAVSLSVGLAEAAKSKGGDSPSAKTSKTTAKKTAAKKTAKAATSTDSKSKVKTKAKAKTAKKPLKKTSHTKSSRHKAKKTAKKHYALPAIGKDGKIALYSAHAFVQDLSTGKVLYEKSATSAVPIASVTKLMTAMVSLDAHPDMGETMAIAQADVDNLRHSRSRLPVGTRLSREEMLRLALMSSENRAASALSRYYPGGQRAFIRAMNDKALALGMFDTYFFDSTGLNASNISSAHDLARMVAAAGQYPLIRQITSTASHDVYIGKRLQHFNNTNSLVRNPDWSIEVSKTGFINEAGKCLVMKAWINAKPTAIILLDAGSSSARLGDSQRIKSWLESPAYVSRQDVDTGLPPGGFE